MLGTLQPPLAIYSSAWLPLILESKTLLNYWFWCPLPLLSIFCPTHNGNSKLCPFLLYSNYLLPWRLTTSHESPFQEKPRFAYQDHSWLFFSFQVCEDSQHFPLDLLDSHPFRPAVLRTPAKGLLALTRVFTSCSQHPVYIPQFHVKSMMFLTGISTRSALCLYSALFLLCFPQKKD